MQLPELKMFIYFALFLTFPDGPACGHQLWQSAALDIHLPCNSTFILISSLLS